MNCGNETKMKKWSSQWTQFMQLHKEAWKKIQDFNGVWTRDLAIPVRCSTSWAMKPLTLGAGQLWVYYIINTHFFHGNIWTHNWPANNNNNNNNNANNRGKLFPRSPFRNSCKGCYEVVWSRQLVLLNERRSYTYAWIAVVNGCLACTFS